MKKRIISVILAVVMVLQGATPALANSPVEPLNNQSIDNKQVYTTEEGAEHTIYWAKGIDAPKMSGTHDIKYKNKYGDFAKELYGNMLTYVTPYVEGKGYYDLNKNFANVDSDSRCYLAAATNIIYWWMDQNKENIDQYIAGIKSGKYIQPEGLTPIYKGQDTDALWSNIRTAPKLKDLGDYANAQFLEDSYLTKNHYGAYNRLKSGYFMDKVFDFFFNGYTAENSTTAEGANPNKVEDYEMDPLGGFFFPIFGKNSLAERIKNPNGQGYKFFSDNMKIWLERGKGITLSMVVKRGTHAITVWGAEYDSQNNLKKLYVTDSDDPSNKPELSGNTVSQGIKTLLVKEDPNGNAHISSYLNPDFNGLFIIEHVTLLDLMEDQWQEILSDENPNPLEPKIVTQPENRTYGKNAKAEPLKVTAEIPMADKNKNAFLTYQWYKAENPGEEGVAIKDATNPNFVPTISREAKEEYYYCQVINNKYGKETKVKSNYAKITTENKEAVDAAKPIITKNLASKEYTIGKKVEPLEVAASISDNGTLTYQWYQSTDSNIDHGWVLSKETNSTFTPPIEKIYTTDRKRAFYFCKVTNTNNNANGKKTSSTISNVATITVKESNLIPQEKLNIEGVPSKAPLYGSEFKLATSGGSGSGNITWEITSGNHYAEIDKAGNVKVKGVGSFTVKATKGEDDNYQEISTTVEITSEKATTKISNITAQGEFYENATKETIENAINYAEENNIPGKITLDGNTITLTPGENNLSWTFTPNDTENYKGDKGTLTIICLNKKPQNPLNITGAPNKTIVYGDTFTLHTKGGSGHGKITWEITSGNHYAEIDKAGNVKVKGVGSFTVKATKAAEGIYEPASATLEITSEKATPLVTAISTSGKFTINSTKDEIEKSITCTSSIPGKIILEDNFSLFVGSNFLNWTFIPDDSTNYKTVTGTIKIQCEEIKQPEPEQPEPEQPGGGGGSAGGGGNYPVEPEKPALPEPEVVNPTTPKEPENGIGAEIGMSETQRVEADKSLLEIITAIINVVKEYPNNKPEENPLLPEMEAENRETVENITEAVKKNEKIQVQITSEKINEKTAPENIQKDIEKIKQHVNKNLKNAEILQVTDLKVNVKAVNYIGENRTLGILTKIKSPISFTIQLPKNTQDSNFSVARIHKGVAELLDEKDVIYNPADKTVTFKTDRFSTYAVCKYEKKITEPEKPERPGKVSKVTVKADNGLFKVSFSKVKDADNYRIYVRQVGHKSGWKYFSTKTSSKIITQLYKKPILKNAKYQVKVVALNRGTYGEYSTVKTFYTNRLANKKASMPTIKFSSIKSKKTGAKTASVKVTAKKVYTKNKPKKLQYRVSYRLSGSSKWKNTSYSSNNVKSIKNLKRGKVYKFAIKYRYESSVDGKTYIYGKTAYKNIRIR